MARKANADLEELRALAVARHKAATRKISRLLHHADVEIGGTKFDPRRPRHNIQSYNRRQLNAYIAELNKFTSRQTQYVRGARGSIITGEAWQKFQVAARAVSKRNRAEFGKIADIQLPNGITIAQRVAMTTPKHPTMGTNLAINRPFEEVRKTSRGIMGNKGALVLAQELQNRMGPRWFSARISKDREAFRKMLAVVNDPRLSEKVDELSDAQFNVLWNYTGFADSLGMTYQNIQDSLIGKEEPYFQEVTAQSLRDVHDLLDWAGTLDMGKRL